MSQHCFKYLRLLTLYIFYVCTTAHADTVNPEAALRISYFPQAQQLEHILERPEHTIDFAQVKLELDKLVDPAIDIEANLQKIDDIVKSINNMLVVGATSMDKMLTIKKYLYESGAWNNYQPYQYDFSDPQGTLIKNKLLPNYLSTKKGNCVSMPMLFIVLGQKLGIDVTASTAPKHVFVKFTDSESGKTYNLETTSGANFSRNVWYQQQMQVTDQALENGIYLEKLSKAETVAVMATLLAENYHSRQEFEKAMVISDIVLKHYPNSVGSMLMKGAISYKLLAKNFIKKYPMPKLIPISERPYFEFLSMSNHYWFQKAEALGWREPTQQDEENYLQIVKQDAGKL